MMDTKKLRLVVFSVICLTYFAPSYACNPPYFGNGTTEAFEQIVIGRCEFYKNVIAPDVQKTSVDVNCSRLYRALRQGILSHGPCDADMDAFTEYVELSFQPLPPNKSMFWEGVYDFVYQFTNLGRRYVGISDVLVGFPLNGLHWCSFYLENGRAPDGYSRFVYNSFSTASGCPDCLHSTERALWRKASIQFASSTSGVARVMLNGTRGDDAAFNVNSTFAQYELPHLQPPRVSELRVYLVHDMGRTIREECGAGSLITLEEIAKSQGLKFTCIDDPVEVLLFQCIDHSHEDRCQLALRDRGDVHETVQGRAEAADDLLLWEE